jgi:plastocyanin
MRFPGIRRIAVTLAAVVLIGCGSSGSNNNPAAPQTPPATSNTITVSILANRGNLSFSPNPVIAGGQLVAFRNTDTIAHRVRLNDLSLDWGVIAPGATSAAIRMPADGTNYHCEIHPTMIGAVAVDMTTPPPACKGDYCAP